MHCGQRELGRRILFLFGLSLLAGCQPADAGDGLALGVAMPLPLSLQNCAESFQENLAAELVISGKFAPQPLVVDSETKRASGSLDNVPLGGTVSRRTVVLIWRWCKAGVGGDGRCAAGGSVPLTYTLGSLDVEDYSSGDALKKAQEEKILELSIEPLQGWLPDAASGDIPRDLYCQAHVDLLPDQNVEAELQCDLQGDCPEAAKAGDWLNRQLVGEFSNNGAGSNDCKALGVASCLEFDRWPEGGAGFDLENLFDFDADGCPNIVEACRGTLYSTDTSGCNEELEGCADNQE